MAAPIPKTAPAPESQPTKPAPAPAPAPSPQPGAGGASAAPQGKRGVIRGRVNQGERIGIYGPGGIGKTELVAALKHLGIEPFFLDLDGGTLGLDVARATVGGELVRDFDAVRAVLHDHELISQFGAVVIDTFSALEDVIRDWVIANVPHEKSKKTINRIEDYGYGKGFNHIFETAMLVLQDLDAICRRGTHAIIVCHQCAEKVPNAEDDDYLEYQPRLQSPPKTGKLRERAFEWANHFYRIDHDRVVEDGKAETGNTRSIHTVRTTTAWAKHRTMPNGREIPPVIPYPKGSYELWQIMFGE